jgi:hypothetical protein
MKYYLDHSFVYYFAFILAFFLPATRRRHDSVSSFIFDLFDTEIRRQNPPGGAVTHLLCICYLLLLPFMLTKISIIPTRFIPDNTGERFSDTMYTSTLLYNFLLSHTIFLSLPTFYFLFKERKRENRYDMAKRRK